MIRLMVLIIRMIIIMIKDRQNINRVAFQSSTLMMVLTLVTSSLPGAIIILFIISIIFTIVIILIIFTTIDMIFTIKTNPGSATSQ